MIIIKKVGKYNMLYFLTVFFNFSGILISLKLSKTELVICLM